MALVTCSHCGTQIEPAAGRCPYCGQAAGQAGAGATASGSHPAYHQATHQSSGSFQPVENTRFRTGEELALREPSQIPGHSTGPHPQALAALPSPVLRGQDAEPQTTGAARAQATIAMLPYTPPSGEPVAGDGLDATRRAGISPTLAISADELLNATAMEGYESIPARRRDVVSRPPGRRPQVRRSWPLLAVLAVGVAALAFAGHHILTAPTASSTAAGTEAEDHASIVELSAGTFSLGLTEDNKEGVLQACFRLSDNPNFECRRSRLEELGEFPARQVPMPAYRIERYEVSNAAYEACTASGACAQRDWETCRLYTHRGYQLNAGIPSRMRTADRPAICVSRDEAAAYCQQAGGRLPTPEQWERAARGGDERLSPWGELWAPNLMNWAETDMGGFSVVGRLDGFDLTAPVTHFEDGETPDGILNMYGNVAEWVAPVEGVEDGVRGGSYRDDLREFRITMQTPLRPDTRRSDVGFRCVYE